MGLCVFSSSAMLLGGGFRVRRSYSLKAKLSENRGFFSRFEAEKYISETKRKIRDLFFALKRKKYFSETGAP